jgi:NADPH-dependent 7-cyano-7-deazaguanine reductase QueF
MTEPELLHLWNLTEPCDQRAFASYDAFRAHISAIHQLNLQTNECRCAFTEHEHILRIDGMCPVTNNPQIGSTITIAYKGAQSFLEIASLRAFVDSYKGGKGDVRSMERMLQEIAQSCADVLRVDVKLTSELLIEPAQVMRICCFAFPQ